MGKETQKNPPKRSADKLPFALVDALGDIQTYRAAIAHFLADTINWPERIITHCDANNWNESVAYDLRESLFKLGCVLGTLATWEVDAGLTRKQVLQADRQLHGEDGEEAE